jgi:hypothetical protein
MSDGGMNLVLEGKRRTKVLLTPWVLALLTFKLTSVGKGGNNTQEGIISR